MLPLLVLSKLMLICHPKCYMQTNDKITNNNVNKMENGETSIYPSILQHNFPV